mmetsp:Transcript_41370/g.98089  ORF Transcript_41370/g.98089 Transcript_41370/m.98089 type:complete len:564 (-) Transcript_41370:5-1696(-)
MRCGKLSAIFIAFVAVLFPALLMLLGLPVKLQLLRTSDANYLLEWTKLNEGKDVHLPSNIFFGLATAPAHVEDQLDDAWLRFAEKGGVAAWKNTPKASDRLYFWTRPEDDLDIASEAKSDLLRLGIDWARVFPSPPGTVDEGEQRKVLARYREITQVVKDRGMKVMMTLFHHSLPPWAAQYGGWTNETIVEDFNQFAKLAIDNIGDLVDFWTVFNEPHVYALLTHCAGMWPPGLKPSPFEMATCLTPIGAYQKALKNMAAAHKQAYGTIKSHARKLGFGDPQVGAAHHVNIPFAFYPTDLPASSMMHYYSTFFFPDLIKDSVDFLGVNYYGQEIIYAADVMIAKDVEYSEAGRAVYPDGLFHSLMAFHRRYGLPLWVTENGVADGTDHLRRPYMLEHIMAVAAAAARGADVRGYVFWTISDNWEWADGYCPRFGLAGVDRAGGNATHPLPRERRPSLRLFREVAEARAVPAEARGREWAALMRRAEAGEARPFCRALEGAGGMTGAFGLDEPTSRPWVRADWRLGRRGPPELPWHETPSLLRPVWPIKAAWDALVSLFDAGEP